jgi:hypothetical protein
MQLVAAANEGVNHQPVKHPCIVSGPHVDLNWVTDNDLRPTIEKVGLGTVILQEDTNCA